MNPALATSPAKSLDALLQRPDIWRFGQLPAGQKSVLRTGYPCLDRVLPAQGWDCGALTEILTNDQGVGELSLLIPALRQTTQQGGSVVLIAPPYLPFPARWEALGILLKHVVMIRAEGQNLLWAAEQTARSGACGMVLVWASSNRRDFNYASLRRLHVAADQGGTTLIAYRPAIAISEASPAPTRLMVSAVAGELNVRIAKRRGALMAETIQLNMYPAHWQVRSGEAAHAALRRNKAALPDKHTQHHTTQRALSVTTLPPRRQSSQIASG